MFFVTTTHPLFFYPFGPSNDLLSPYPHFAAVRLALQAFYGHFFVNLLILSFIEDMILK